MIKRILLLLIYVALFIPSKGKEKEPDLSIEVAILNGYVQYLNQFNETLWEVHQELDKTNRAWNLYLAKKGSHPPAPMKKRGWNELKNTHQQLIVNGSSFPDLKKRWDQLALLQNRLAANHTDLVAFLQRAESTDKSIDQNELYKKLKSFAVLFEDFAIVKGETYFTLKTAFNGLSPVRTNDAISQTAESFESIIELSRNILHTVKSGRSGTTRKYQEQLAQKLQVLAENRHQMLYGLTRQGNSRRDPYLRFDEFIKQGRMFSKLTEAYLTAESIPPLYQRHSRAYYHFNFQLVQKFSRKDQGLIDQFNHFIQLTEAPVLMAVGESHWFQPLAQIIQEENVTIENASVEAPQRLVFLLDVSGSMGKSEKLPLFKQSFVQLISQLKPSDQVALVTYSGNAKVLLSPTSVQEKATLIAALQKVQVSGKSDPIDGFQLAYEVAQQQFQEEANNRIVLITDGGFPIEGSLPKLVEENGYRKIPLCALYFGNNEAKMRDRLTRLANISKGTYGYIHPNNASVAFPHKVLRRK